MVTPTLSIITGTRNREDSLRRLVRSVQLHTDVEYELIIADASDTPIDASDYPANIVIIPERPRLHFSAGYNRACSFARGKWVLMLNDDCEVTEHYASHAVDFMERYSDRIGMGALPYSNLGGPFMINYFWELPYANFPILSKDLGDKIGWHDTDLRMYGADNSLTFRVLLAGFGIAEIPNARVIHHEHPDLNRVENQHDRYTEADKLHNKYYPLLGQMKAAYESARVVTV